MCRVPKVGLWQKSRVNETKRKEETKMEVRDRRRGGKEIIGATKREGMTNSILTRRIVRQALFRYTVRTGIPV